jgi:endonuclease/exonuclease/phosphatase family metal-dependent hydrolase
MRFSVLTLNLHTWQEPDQLEKFDRIARYVAEQNISCLCLQECGQRESASIVDADEGLRADNAALIIHERLERYGLKYGMIWSFSHYSFGAYEEGSAILTQLPILGRCSRFVSADDDPASVQSRNVVMARLAAAPNAVVDVYSAHLSPPESGLGDQLAALGTFVEETPEVLETMKPPPPKRRGPPPKRVPVQETVISTRLVCVAGDFNDEPAGVGEAMKSAGFLDASSAAREAQPGVGTFSDGRWLDYVFIRPALRPHDARVVFTGDDSPPVSDHRAVAVEFEV